MSHPNPQRCIVSKHQLTLNFDFSQTIVCVTESLVLKQCLVFQHKAHNSNHGTNQPQYMFDVDSNHGSPLIPSLGFVYSERRSGGYMSIICHQTPVGMMTGGAWPSQIRLLHEQECIKNKGSPTVEWTSSVCACVCASVCVRSVCLCVSRKAERRCIDKCSPCTILREMSPSRA